MVTYGSWVHQRYVVENKEQDAKEKFTRSNFIDGIPDAAAAMLTALETMMGFVNGSITDMVMGTAKVTHTHTTHTTHI